MDNMLICDERAITSNFVKFIFWDDCRKHEKKAMTILEILYHSIVTLIGLVIISTDHGSDFEDKSLKDVVNTGFKTIGFLLLVGGLMHLIGLTLILPKP